MHALRLWVRLILFAGTISPLLILQGIVLFDDSVGIAALLLTFGTALFFYPVALFWLTSDWPVSVHKITEARFSTPNVASFLLTYLLPLVGLSFADATQVIVLGFLVLLMAVVYTHGGLLYVQPIFFLLGWEVYECLKSSGEWCWVLTKDPLMPGDIRAQDIGGHTLILGARPAQPAPEPLPEITAGRTETPGT